MGKGRKSGKASRAEGAVKIPKTIGGIKLPKELRKAGNAVLTKANSPAGRELAATGLTLAASALAASARSASAKPRPADGTRPAVAEAATSLGAADPHAVGVALGSLAVAALSGLFGGKKPA